MITRVGVVLEAQGPLSVVYSRMFQQPEPKSSQDMFFISSGEQGWRQCGPFAVSSLLCSESFFSGFPLSTEPNISKFQFDPVAGPPWKPLPG